MNTTPRNDTGPGAAADFAAGVPLEQAGRFPVLDRAQLDLLRTYGTEQEIAPGDILFAEGDETYDLIVVIEGEVQIARKLGTPKEAFLASYRPGQFIGEMGMLTGQRAFLAAVARTAGRILRVPVAQVRQVMAQEPGLSELILRTFLIRHANLTALRTGLILIGSRFDTDTRRILDVLARNRLPTKWMDLEESPDAERLLQRLQVPVEAVPIVIVPGRPLLRNPTNHELLDVLGLSGVPATGTSRVYDLLVVGGGPAGLSAAVYGASDGLSTILAEDAAFGGQAGTSSRIENYLGFPAGLSGEELAARALLQAQKFGVQTKLAAKAVALSSEGGVHRVTFDDGEVIAATSLVVATGASYNRLPLDRLADFERLSVYYAATQSEAQSCAGGPVAVVGGGNSAGQAAVFLSRSSPKVYILIRGGSLEKSMSRYLIDQIERNPRIEVRTHTEITALVGDGRLAGLDLVENVTRLTSSLAVRALFVFIGARPCMEWLDGQLAADDHGFLLTGTDIPPEQNDPDGPTPLYLETSRAGIFAVGDVRSGSVKRVAAAIGEGSVAVQLLFERLQASGIAAANTPVAAR
jgi:thioredoxin reductase (NADPH)